MRCPECGFEVAESDVFCGSCGSELVESADKAAAVKEQPEQDELETKKSKPKKGEKGKKKKISGINLKTILIGAGVVLAIVIIVIIIVYVSASVKAAKGRKVFDKVPLGRNADMIESVTEEVFVSGEGSPYGALNYIADYDYICESEDSVEVDGINLPEWAVLLNKDYSGNINKATLYNFSVLKRSWMGEKKDSKIDSSVIEYDMKLKAAERKLGLKPYTIIKENDGNTSTYAYRYHYTDNASGNTCVMNFYVVVDDSDNQKVKYVYEEQLDYLNLILRGTSEDTSR